MIYANNDYQFDGYNFFFDLLNLIGRLWRPWPRTQPRDFYLHTDHSTSFATSGWQKSDGWNLVACNYILEKNYIVVQITTKWGVNVFNRWLMKRVAELKQFTYRTFEYVFPSHMDETWVYHHEFKSKQQTSAQNHFVPKNQQGRLWLMGQGRLWLCFCNSK